MQEAPAFTRFLMPYLFMTLYIGGLVLAIMAGIAVVRMSQSIRAISETLTRIESALSSRSQL